MMTQTIAIVDASLGELVDKTTRDDTRSGLQVVLAAVGDADASGSVGLRDIWDGLHDGEFLAGPSTGSRYSGRSAGRSRATEGQQKRSNYLPRVDRTGVEPEQLVEATELRESSDQQYHCPDSQHWREHSR